MRDTALSISVLEEFVTEQCFKCGVTFAMTRQHRQYFLDHRSEDFYCPNGHGQHYLGETEAQRLHRMLDEANRTNTELVAENGKLQRQAKRVKRGVCPCCKRSFLELGRHMATKHPEYAK